jgi:hypothetical protein
MLEVNPWFKYSYCLNVLNATAGIWIK